MPQPLQWPKRRGNIGHGLARRHLFLGGGEREQGERGGAVHGAVKQDFMQQINVADLRGVSHF